VLTPPTRRNSTLRQFRRVGVGGVYWALRNTSVSTCYVVIACLLFYTFLLLLLVLVLVLLSYAEPAEPCNRIFVSSVKRLDPTGKLR